MKEYDEMDYFKPAEELVAVLCNKTQNANPAFFRILVAYYFCKVASMMRCSISTKDRGEIPVSMYALNLANSGSGKGMSTNIMEEEAIQQFRERFLEETFPLVSVTNLENLARKRHIKKATEYDEELESIKVEFNGLGTLAFSFDSGTTAAVKQMRHKLLMANAGSMNMEIDEVGSNLLGNIDVLTTFLELFDVGKVKQKLTKNTAENTRSEEIPGRTPTNMLLFGVPSKLLNGAKIEEEFYSMLESGYARRCFFGLSQSQAEHKLTALEVYNRTTDPASKIKLVDLSDQLGQLANRVNFQKTLSISKDVSLILIEYRLDCESKANLMPDHEEVKKAELTHRYYKTLKLAGAYAFIDGSHEVTEDHVYNAIKLSEDSGEAFNKILKRERNYVKLANYIASVGREVTHVDIMEDLPLYKGSESQKREMMTLAIAYGYKNNIIIKRQYNDGIEFLKGESLQETDLDSMIISYSKDLAEGYLNETVKFDDLDKLITLSDYNFCSHHFIEKD